MNIVVPNDTILSPKNRQRNREDVSNIILAEIILKYLSIPRVNGMINELGDPVDEGIVVLDWKGLSRICLRDPFVMFAHNRFTRTELPP